MGIKLSRKSWSKAGNCLPIGQEAFYLVNFPVNIFCLLGTYRDTITACNAEFGYDPGLVILYLYRFNRAIAYTGITLATPSLQSADYPNLSPLLTLVKQSTILESYSPVIP
jgi:hypothetical protein